MKTNAYPGKCHLCSTAVGPKEGTISKFGRKWLVKCGSCQPFDPNLVEHIKLKRLIPNLHVVSIGGKHYHRNPRGRCEDAPCCGCCTI